MTTTFPTTIDAFTNITDPTTTTLETEVGGRTHSEFHNDYNDALEALQAKVGVDSSAVATSLDYKVTALEAGFPNASVDGEIALFSGTTGKVLKRDTTTGILKGTSGVISAATPGTDYLEAGDVTTSGLTMATAKLLGRTTASSGAIEEIAIGEGLSMAATTLTATRVGADVYASSAVTITTTPTAVAFNLENWDSGGVHDNVTNNTRLTAPETGVYMVGIRGPVFTDTAGAYEAIATIRKGGATALGTLQVTPISSGSAGYGNFSFSFPISLTANEYIELLVSKSSATPTMNIQNTATEFSFFMYK